MVKFSFDISADCPKLAKSPILGLTISAVFTKSVTMCVSCAAKFRLNAKYSNITVKILLEDFIIGFLG